MADLAEDTSSKTGRRRKAGNRHRRRRGGPSRRNDAAGTASNMDSGSEMVKLRITHAISGNHLCDVNLSRSRMISTAKHCISEAIHMPVTEQRVLLGTTELQDSFQLAELPLGDFVDLTLVQEAKGITGFLASILARAMEENPEDTKPDWDSTGNFSYRELLGQPSTEAAVCPFCPSQT
eukprot:CAMPEP_0179072118 /NCGR_PEP_ID=MMETSP0796-20121207/31889_1 /TAXON_ID=73915 /ORGANISM="Pyrodinium bahamense, Strain pbaha01" /LENGTH=178 /DNA_ID=CAMNT_0020769267 /DNA_START=92 /DNA_END=628 /DNA_ORIENTATION=+